MNKIRNLKQLNRYLIHTIGANHFNHQNCNKDVLPYVRDALDNYNKNNNQDWIREVFKSDNFYLDNKYNNSENRYIPINRHIITSSKYYEMCLLNWNPFQKSSIHNHPKGGCFLIPMNGCLLETQFEVINMNNNNYNFNTNQLFTIDSKDVIKKEDNILPINSVNYIDDTIGVHQVENNSDKNVISLHVYLF